MLIKMLIKYFSLNIKKLLRLLTGFYLVIILIKIYKI